MQKVRIYRESEEKGGRAGAGGIGCEWGEWGRDYFINKCMLQI